MYRLHHPRRLPSIPTILVLCFLLYRLARNDPGPDSPRYRPLLHRSVRNHRAEMRT